MEIYTNTSPFEEDTRNVAKLPHSILPDIKRVVFLSDTLYSWFLSMSPKIGFYF
ncbi:hypothetical protein CES85_5523 [Ochrobactrum quorumnocens]|uniref:Uncharacterized protein n=1 Tax=Ochrobactrum quorumnocens TaxID=271865 RepID=A0A248UD28_9HYPH|nr:hypothetical protein CES85_5523 [[Ochrobactrum] quorumnocens]